jgi:chromosome segregation ATPase
VSISSSSVPAVKLTQAFVQTAISAQLMDQTAQSILNEPDLSNQSIPSLASDVQASKQSASLWLNTLSPQVASIKNDIITFSTQFNQEFSMLNSLVPQVGAGDATATAQFQSILNTLNSQVTAKQGEVQKLNTDLASFRVQVEANGQTLAGDTQQANAQIGGLQSEMQQVSQQLAKVNSELARERSASGIALRILEDIFSMGLAELANNQSHLENEANQSQDRLAQLQEQTGQLYQVSLYLSQFDGVTGQLVTGVTGLSTAWQTLGTRLNEVMTNVSASSVFLIAQLQEIQSDWQEVLSAAEELQS